MTPDELWQKVGALLKHERESRGWTLAYLKEKSGIDTGTITSNESGDVGTVKKLQAHCFAFSLTCVDIIATALEETRKPLSPEARRIVTLVEGMSVKARRAMLDTAEVIAEGSAPEDRRSPSGQQE